MIETDYKYLADAPPKSKAPTRRQTRRLEESSSGQDVARTHRLPTSLQRPLYYRMDRPRIQ
jgi:hypothetical protein